MTCEQRFEHVAGVIEGCRGEIEKKDVPDYLQRYKPIVLRWNRSSNTMGLPGFNIGVVKGKTFDRVLIFATEPMKAYLKTRDLTKAGGLEKLYVAVTRARYRVAFAK